MIIFKLAKDLHQYLVLEMHKNQAIGFVPTMGALHAGHSALVKTAKADGCLTVCSIFVNPTQFNDKNDFEKYPVSTEDDIEILIKNGCDVLFLPSVDEMYPGGTFDASNYDFGYLDTILEGAKRPGHFKGVGQIVSKLVNIVQPQYLYLGQKDYQQCMVIKKLLELMGIQNKTTLKICPTVREADGLAMSSRNRRLTEPQRAVAGAIYQCLVSIQSKKDIADFEVVKKECTDLLRDKGFVPEYIALADANDLTQLDNYDPSRKMTALIAAWIGNVRLIDNMVLN